MRLNGQPAAPGIGIGRVYRLGSVPAITDPPQTTEVAQEMAKYGRARAEVRRALTVLEEQVRARAGIEAAEIIGAQRLMVDDPELEAAVAVLISEHYLSAAAAVERAGEDLAAALGALPDAYLRSRAADVLDVTGRLARTLRGDTPATAQSAVPSALPVGGTPAEVLVAEELLPSDVARLDPERVVGLVTSSGSAGGHAALLARALGIPAVFAVGEAAGQIRTGATVVVDGGTGSIVVNPGSRQLATFMRAREQFRAEGQRLAALRGLPAETCDGRRRLALYANVNTLADLEAAVRAGAEGVGLLRSEFLYLHRTDLPGEDEHYLAYRRALEGMGGRPVIIRTLDAGGDKPLPGLTLAPEANPALGRRGVRLWLVRPELWRPQLRGLLRAAAHGDLRILLPMVTVADEIVQARALLAQACAELAPHLRPQGLPPVGAMIEVPAAALSAPALAAVCGFFSVGTNDLAQYALAADRMNPAVGELLQPLHPAVLQLCRLAVTAAHSRGIPCGLCGEVAGDPRAVPALVGLGFDSLSVAPVALPGVKAAIRCLGWDAAQSAADQALAPLTGES